MSFLPGFALRTVETAAGAFRLRRGGAGPPLLLLHGNPQTHAMWHATAPALAERFDVIAPDLPGYGRSFKPAPAPDHAPHSKRAMAAALAALLDALAIPRTAVVAHDRGARVAHRLALDHPGRVDRLALLDIVPTLDHFERADAAFALGYYHWFWLAQPRPFPERLIDAAPETWWRAHVSREPKDPDAFFHPEALADYLACARDPAVIEGMCEDYRAAASIDLAHDRASRAAGARIACPLLILWGARGRIGEWYDPLALWSAQAEAPPQGAPIPAGHYLAEEAPEATLAALLPFLEGRSTPP